MAQLAGSASINGTVTDASGAVVPGVSITLRETSTGFERRTESNDAGIYNAAFLAPGRYEITASKTGFSTLVRKDVTLQVGQTLTADFAVTVAQTQTAVTVTTVP